VSLRQSPLADCLDALALASMRAAQARNEVWRCILLQRRADEQMSAARREMEEANRELDVTAKKLAELEMERAS